MSYATMVAGLHERFATVTAIKVLLDYEPKSFQETPGLYTLLDSFERIRAGQITVMKYRILHRLCIKWQDNEGAELELIPFVNSIPASVSADPLLGGRIIDGLAQIVSGQGTFVKIGGTIYRALDFFSAVTEKGTNL